MKSYNVCLKDTVKAFTKKVFYSLFDCDHEAEHAEYLEKTFLQILDKLEIENGEKIWETFKAELPEIRRKLDLDAIAFENNDPASHCLAEIYMAYPGFHAISIYRLSHALYKLGVYILPRMMSEYIHGITGIDIHPGATIGESFYIDHGTGIVIGETSIIGEQVKIYQGVTLGGIQVSKDLASTKRHPTIDDNVTIYANATILGGDIVIGKNSIIGANVWITQSVPEDSLVTYQTEIKIRPKKNGIR
ncbi:serine O-acetyltransferase EpsC [Algibacter lectus]|uniref:Serine O-acetyltransferase n=1 Tax=Algibacter lectus TaxID=221126 RepID=A0A090WSX2_9FLAO|nr:serine O-acetyltransferase EpsC [Algibacter lectus]MDO7135456.1 serine O-acetyltransferase EpsC [Algibacter lectus]MWW24886.1 serine acetyltransferase [Algibacter lectus]TDY64703.1 serine O-acetyltransferase [Algibacter lectus]SFD23754.1 serine O-acetyltransferase [Algibacter lectus]GAL79343.1 serine acetyltransferase [Algibacter lectus]